jgi:hypothetical protein
MNHHTGWGKRRKKRHRLLVVGCVGKLNGTGVRKVGKERGVGETDADTAPLLTTHLARLPRASLELLLLARPGGKDFALIRLDIRQGCDPRLCCVQLRPARWRKERERES